MQTANKIKNRTSAKSWIDEQKANGKTVVFTNGCFDILHLGHIDYLEKAKSLGDALIIGLNDDDSVRRLKGPERPVNDKYARARMLAALHFVDAVCVFEEDTPGELIDNLVPNVLVKGGDYTIDTIVGAETVINNGGEVKTIELVDGFSTTGIIEKLKS